MLNLRRINDQPGSPRLNSHILRQPDSQCGVVANLNLDAFNQIMDSPSDLTELNHMQNAQRNEPSSEVSSAEERDRFSHEHENDIQEVCPYARLTSFAAARNSLLVLGSAASLTHLFTHHVSPRPLIILSTVKHLRNFTRPSPSKP